MTTKTWATAATRTVAAVIQQTPIRRDQEGRYCLNDLHRAAGGAPKHGPDRFMRLESTSAFSAAIANSPEMANKSPVEMSRGRYGGTYVHEDLAIDYAAWISPEFKRAVYQAFKETRKEKVTDLGTVVAPAGCAHR